MNCLFCTSCMVGYRAVGKDEHAGKDNASSGGIKVSVVLVCNKPVSMGVSVQLCIASPHEGATPVLAGAHQSLTASLPLFVSVPLHSAATRGGCKLCCKF